MSQTILEVAVPVVLDANGQAQVTFTDGKAVLGRVRSTVVATVDVASKITVDGTVIDSCLDAAWDTVGNPVDLAGTTVVVDFDGGSVAAGAAGTVYFGVSPA